MCCLLQAGPHNAAANKIGTSSFAAIPTSSHASGQQSCHHVFNSGQMAPQPNEPDASEKR